MATRPLRLIGLFAVLCVAFPATVHAGATGGSGSLLLFPNVELKWGPGGALVQDTMLRIANGFYTDVLVQMYFVNGDEPLAPVLGPDGTVIERGHPGWNHSDCTIRVPRYQTVEWSAATGRPGACSFATLDLGNPPGRPDPEAAAGRVLRGFIYAWAVDLTGREVSWNYLSGSARIVGFGGIGSWGYEAAAFRALIGAAGDALPDAGMLRLDNIEYEKACARLLLSYRASGQRTYPVLGVVEEVDTDLTLMPVSQDLRQDNDGPITTKARFEIYNAYGVGFSGTERCLICWDQTFLGNYRAPNYFLRPFIHTDTGFARIDGIASGVVCGPYSQPAALTGVAVEHSTYRPLNAQTISDWNDDGIVDLADYVAFFSCLNESGPFATAVSAQCRTAFDLDEDGDVDFRDYRGPAAADESRTSITVSLICEGEETATILYDIPTGPSP